MKRLVPILRGLAFVVTALAAADVVGALVASRIPVGEPAAQIARTSVRGARPSRRNTRYYVKPVVDRNLFWAAGGRNVPPPAMKMTDEELPESALAKRFLLVGTVVATPANASKAFIEEKGQDQVVLGIGSLLADTAEVVSIEPRRIVVVEDGKEEEIPLHLGDGPGFSKAKRTARTTGGSGASDEEIRKEEDGNYTLDAQFVEEQLSNLSDLITQVRAVPNFDENGQTNGFRLFSIKRGSLFEKVGMRNGDVIRRINEYDLSDFDNDPTVALQVFQELRGARDFDVTVSRNGEDSTVGYRVR